VRGARWRVVSSPTRCGWLGGMMRRVQPSAPPPCAAQCTRCDAAWTHEDGGRAPPALNGGNVDVEWVRSSLRSLRPTAQVPGPGSGSCSRKSSTFFSGFKHKFTIISTTPRMVLMENASDLRLGRRPSLRIPMMFSLVPSLIDVEICHMRPHF
jgi:hypothetical protein